MSVFKCKMCGGTMEVEQGTTVCTCEYCGTQQTLPKLDDERRVNLYDRANHFRRNNEFDKAMGIYESILNEDSSDAEAYWSLVLCRYGIEYVEDPATHKRLPTVNRAQYTSIYADEDYKSAIANADTLQKTVYETEAKAIDDIQKRILEISAKEEPFDVFISFKETDANGRRTPDTVLANDLYHQLTQEGYKVFYAPITLEDKLGQEYEPYIFAALNSAKVMVVLGTKAEYFNAVWVKNEWSRFLSLIKGGAKKTLIPAYKDMDPYDLPEEFSHLMAQDMSKLGFMQDLLRGIKKITAADEAKPAVKETVIVNNASSAPAGNTAPLLKRAFMFLEDGDWQRADDFCEQVLNQDPENAQAYLGKLLAELKVKKPEALKNCAQPFDSNRNYNKIIRFADSALSDQMKGYIESINERNENARLSNLYGNALNKMKIASDESQYRIAAAAFHQIREYKDSSDMEKECLKRAEESSNNRIYNNAMNLMNRGLECYYSDAISEFSKIHDWKDSDKKILECKNKIADIQTKEKAAREEAKRKAEEARLAAEKAAKKRKNAFIVFLIIVGLAVAGYFGYTKYYVPKNNKYYVGNTLTFGTYEQDNITDNGKEAIEWIVLANDGKKALLISKYALDAIPYNKNRVDITWENCSLRTWLNSDFYNSAFSAEEKNHILKSMVPADINPKNNTDPGNPTEDYVFLLSVAEAEKYFSTDESRNCLTTEYAYVKWYSDSNNTSGEKASCGWRLRSPGETQRYAAIVCIGGSIKYVGYGVTGEMCVRPAMWINLDA